MSYIDKIYNDKNQTKLIRSFRSQPSGYLWGKESVVAGKKHKKGF